MSVTEDRRIALLKAAHQHWGRDVAVTLMEMLPPSGWGDVATRQRVDALERDMDLRFQLVDQRFDAMETKLTARIDALDARLGAELSVVRREMQAGFATTEARTIRWVVGTGLAIIGAVSGLGGLLLALR
jgi:hypothetical protein